MPESLEKLVAKNLTIIEDDILLWKELPEVTVDSAKTFGEAVRKLSSNDRPFYIIVDLSKAGRPDALARRQLQEEFRNMPGLKKIAIFYKTNFIIKIAAKFVTAGIDTPISVHDTYAEALELVQKLKERDENA